MGEPNQTQTNQPEAGMVVGIKQQFEELGQVKRSFSEEQMKFVMKTIAPTLDENETWLFLLKASKVGLNPLLGEITAYSSTNNQGQRQLVIIDTRNGKRASAYRRKQVKKIITEAIYIKEVAIPATDQNPKPTGTMKIRVEPWDGTLWGAESYVWTYDTDEPSHVRVPLKEYNRGNKVWQEKPETMIKKVAESQALSAAIPDMSGVYDEAEDWRQIAQPALQAPTMEDGTEPATEDQLKTLTSLNYSREDLDKMNITKQEAANLIIEAAQLKQAEKKGK